MGLVESVGKENRALRRQNQELRASLVSTLAQALALTDSLLRIVGAAGGRIEVVGGDEWTSDTHQVVLSHDGDTRVFELTQGGSV